MAGDIAAVATNGSYALGIYSSKRRDQHRLHRKSTGSITAEAGASNAYGLYVLTGVSITGEMAGDIAAKAGTDTALWLVPCRRRHHHRGMAESSRHGRDLHRLWLVRIRDVTISGEISGSITATATT